MRKKRCRCWSGVSASLRRRLPQSRSCARPKRLAAEDKAVNLKTQRNLFEADVTLFLPKQDWEADLTWHCYQIMSLFLCYHGARHRSGIKSPIKNIGGHSCRFTTRSGEHAPWPGGLAAVGSWTSYITDCSWGVSSGPHRHVGLGCGGDAVPTRDPWGEGSNTQIQTKSLIWEIWVGLMVAVKPWHGNCVASSQASSQ